MNEQAWLRADFKSAPTENLERDGTVSIADEIMKRAEKYRNDVTQFLRDIVAIPSYSGQEKEVVDRISEEMHKVGFDEVKTDGLGNIFGRIGNGKTVIAMDAHIDVVGVGDASQWKHDPFKGKIENGIVYGRGAGDQKAGMASMVYAGKIIKDLHLEGDYTLYVVGSVMEEACDGMCWQYIVKEDEFKPDYVVITEPTNLNIYRGHRGRIEVKIQTKGKSAHAAMPEMGDNAIYKMARIVLGIEKLNDELKPDPFLGKGTAVVSQIFFKSPSENAVADECTIHIDRRLTKGETRETAIEEFKKVIKDAGVEAKILEQVYDGLAYTGKKYSSEKYFRTWVMDENSDVVQSAVETYKTLFKSDPKVDKWNFSTNGVATAGLFNIPTVGFGPANEIYAHGPDDQAPVDHLVKAAAFYAYFPQTITKRG